MDAKELLKKVNALDEQFGGNHGEHLTEAIKYLLEKQAEKESE